MTDNKNPKEKSRIIPELLDEMVSGGEPDLLSQLKTQRDPRSSKNAPFKISVFLISVLIVVAFIPVKLNISGPAKLVAKDMRLVNAIDAGVLKQLNYKEGDYVKEGSVIGSLHSIDTIAQLKEAQDELNTTTLQIDQIKNRLQWLDKMVERNKSLYDAQVVSLTDFEKSKLEQDYYKKELQIFENRVIYLKDKISLFSEKVKFLELIAPISGVISLSSSEKVGAFLNKGDEVCKIIDMKNAFLEFQVDERYAPKIKPGQKVYMRFITMPGVVYKGEVEKVGSVAWERTVKVWVKENVVNVSIKPDSLPENIKYGLTARIKIDIGWMPLYRLLLVKLNR